MLTDIKAVKCSSIEDATPQSWPAEGQKIRGSRNSAYTPSAILLQRRFDREPLKLQKQMIPHFLALDVGIKICQAQLFSSIRGCHATVLVKNTLFKGEVA